MHDFLNTPFLELGLDGGFKKFPFIKINKDENVMLLFLEALKTESTEHAKKYISKNYVDLLDFNEIREFFETNGNFKIIKKLNFDRSPKNHKTNSIIFVGNTEGKGDIVNIHMVLEPDKYSLWKIFAFDQESVV